MNSFRMPKTVFFMPTQANIKMTKIISRIAPLNEVRFVPLVDPSDYSPNFEACIEAVKRLEDRKAVLLWGSGSYHHLSYYFDLTPNGKPIVKINIDGHDDFLDYSFADWPFESIPLNCASHMLYSARRDGFTAHTIVPESVPTSNHITIAGKRIVDPIVHDLEIKGDFELQLTIDLDAITSFPAEPEWITPNGMELDMVIEILAKAMQTGNLSRLDFGGLVNNIPEFQPAGDIRRILTPRITADDKWHLISVENLLGEPKELIHMMLTFAASCFYRILKTAMFD